MPGGHGIWHPKATHSIPNPSRAARCAWGASQNRALGTPKQSQSSPLSLEDRGTWDMAPQNSYRTLLCLHGDREPQNIAMGIPKAAMATLLCLHGDMGLGHGDMGNSTPKPARAPHCAWAWEHRTWGPQNRATVSTLGNQDPTNPISMGIQEPSNPISIGTPHPFSTWNQNTPTHLQGAPGPSNPTHPPGDQGHPKPPRVTQWGSPHPPSRYLWMKTRLMPRARAMAHACCPPAPPKHASTCRAVSWPRAWQGTQTPW